jgi:hypothetical protein
VKLPHIRQHRTYLLRPPPPPPAKGDDLNSVTPNSRRSVPKLIKTKGHTSTQQQVTTQPREENSSHSSDQNLLQSAEFPDLTGPRSLQFQQPTHANTPPRQRLGSSSTEHQTMEFINCVRAFNPNFSFLYLLQTVSVILLQLVQYPYESALPVIFSINS